MNFTKLTPQKFNAINFNVHLSKKTNASLFITQLSKFIQLLYKENIKNESLLTKKRAPYIIGINGSVSSGKSYFAEKIEHVLKCLNPTLKIGLLSTDNFIYSNKILNDKKIFHKGFTESYDWRLLFKTLKSIKKNKAVTIPYYSQNLSDIHPSKHSKLPDKLDILIVEGVNLLKPTCKSLKKNLCKKLLLSDYIDYSIYIDAPEKNLKSWFHERLNKKKTLWKKKGIKKNLTRKNKKAFKKFTSDIWDKYNSPNLKKNISPFRYRSDMIIHKNKLHKIDFIEFKI